MAKSAKNKLITNGVVARNKQVALKFEIIEKIEAGLMLLGSEVKSLRQGVASINEAFAIFRRDDFWLMKANIPPYEYSTILNHEPTRPRKLLLHKREKLKLCARLKEKGFTLVPLSVYFNDRGIAKLELALVRGKRQHDKRDTLRKREVDDQIRRRMRASK